MVWGGTGWYNVVRVVTELYGVKLGSTESYRMVRCGNGVVRSDTGWYGMVRGAYGMVRGGME